MTFTLDELDAVAKLIGTMTLVRCQNCPWINITPGHTCPCCGKDVPTTTGEK